MAREVEGDVARLRCSSCEAVTHNVVFSGDTDMATMGLISLASIERPEVVIAEAIGHDLRSGSDASGLSTQRRVSAAMLRADLRYLRVLRTEFRDTGPTASFQAF